MTPQTRARLFGAGGASAPADFGLLLFRLFVGLALALGHGLGKLPPSEGFVGAVGGLGFPAPELFAWMAGLSEFVGGLLIAVGLMTRPAAGFVLFTFLVAVFGQHGGDPFVERELAALYGAAALLLLFTGAGRYSLDALIGRDKTKPIWR